MEAAAKSVDAVRKLIDDLNLPKTMSEVGISESLIESMAAEAYKSGQRAIGLWNPRDANEADVAQIFRAAL